MVSCCCVDKNGLEIVVEESAPGIADREEDGSLIAQTLVDEMDGSIQKEVAADDAKPKSLAAVITDPEPAGVSVDLEMHQAQSLSGTSMTRKMSDINVFFEMYDAAKFHLAVDELELGPEFNGKRGGLSDDQENKMKMAEFMGVIFREVREAIPTGVMPNKPGQRRQQTRLIKDIADIDVDREKQLLRQEFLQKGFERASPPECETTCFMKIDYKAKRTYASFDMPNLEFSAIDFLKLGCEIEESHTWFPFMKSAKVLHGYEGSAHCLRLLQSMLKVAFLTLESVTVGCLEDRLEETGCLCIYIYSPPDEIMSKKEGGPFLGGHVPAPLKGSFDIRMPFAWNRVIINPVNRNTVSLKVDLCVIDKVPPVGWIIRMFYKELSKQIAGIMTKTVKDLHSNSVGEAAKKKEHFYEAWNQKLESHYARIGMYAPEM